MKVIEIGGIDYKMPEGWFDVSVEKFEKIMKHSSLLNEYKSQTLFALEMFSILLDAPVDVVKRLSRESYQILSDECVWVNKDIKPSNRMTFEIEGDLYIPIKDLNKMNMGEAIDLELIINDSTKEELLINILPILIRKAKPIIKENGETELIAEDYDADIYAKNKELFKKHLMISDVIKFKDFFLNGEK